MENNTPDFITLLTFYDEKKSKKSTPISSGHRLKFNFPFTKETIIGMLTFSDVELVYPNDIAKAQVKLFTDEINLNKLYIGLDFDIFEGDKQIGTGIVSSLMK